MQYPQLAVVVSLCLSASACGGPTDPSLLPVNYESTFTEVRNCRRGADHDLNFVRILVDDAAHPAYTMRDRPFPTGSVIVKEEYDPTDEDCTQIVIGWTVMVADPVATEALGWTWQRIDEFREPLDLDTRRCISCHTDCGKAPDGYAGTCSIPP